MGVPVVGGGLPATYGTYYFVNSNTGEGSDGNSGLDMDNALATVAAAYAKTTSGAHDVIVCSGNTAHTIADEITVSKNRVHFWGLGLGSRYMGQRTRFEMGVTTGSAIAIIQNTGVGNTFTNIKFRSTDSLSTSLYSVADGGEFSQWTNCSFEKDEDLDQTTAAELLCNADTGYYKSCSIGNTIYARSVARACILLTRETITGKVCRDTIFEDCIIQNNAGATTVLHVYGANANDVERLLLFKRCIFWTNAASASTQAVAFSFGAAQTVGDILLDGCTTHGPTDTCVDGGVAVGIFTNSSAKADDATDSLQAGAT
jgi:hypothetical protein